MTHDEILRKIEHLRDSSGFALVLDTKKNSWVAYVIDFRDAKHNDDVAFVISSHTKTFYSDTFDSAATLAIDYIEGKL